RTMTPKRLSILGVGLLGGSLGLAVKAAAMPCRIVGYGHRRSTLDKALASGAIDEAADTPADAVKGADLVILCTPVGLFRKTLADIAPALLNGAIVTDVGSTKRSVVRDARDVLPKYARFVGSHPMAGSEKRGVDFARADLFQGARCILTPDESSDPAALASVDAFWRALGMRTTVLSPADHDRLVSDVSHLPHALAATLVTMQDAAALPLAGKGFLDATRIAGGDGGLWRDIFLDNRDQLAGSLTRFRATLDAFIRLLDEGKGEELAQWLDAAASRRAALLAEKLREMNPD
ncbi:MAG TPA: prephenate dehydrogenase, partial [Beijerinckiaceae bacterium]|nr:prephenate dehydrogenase [Beijerinckiaceae bacterium]